MITTRTPQIDLNIENRKVLLKSAPTHWVKKVSSISNVSTSNVNFTCPSPSRTTFTDRRMVFNGVLQLTFTGTTTGGLLLVEGYDAPRAYTFQSIIQSIQLNLDNQTFSFLPQQMLPGLSHYMEREMDDEGPRYLDKFTTYLDGFGTIRSELDPYVGGLDHNSQRGSGPFIVVSNTNLQTVIQIPIWERIFIPPFIRKNSDELGLTNYSNMDVQFILSSSLSRAWSHGANPNATITGIVAAWTGIPQLHLGYYTGTINYIPRPVTYKCDQYTVYKTVSSSTCAYNVANDLSTNSIQFSVIPNRVYVWVQGVQDGVKTYTDPDTFFRINGIDVSFGNVVGILSSCDTYDLYQMSRMNGCQDSFQEWYGQYPVLATASQKGAVGSVLCLKFGSDIPLSDEFHPGMPGSFNFQINRLNVTSVNQNVANYANPTIYILTVVDSWLTLGDVASRENGVVPQAESQETPFNALSEYYGGDISEKAARIMSFLSKVNDFLKSSGIISKTTSMIPIPMAQTISAAAKNLGYGIDDDLVNVAAGKMLSTAELKRRIKRL